ncbi:amino acid--[acyl-carrier-protein] ligase [Methylocystis sp. JAN1]|uniref:amino acid--[acyl-carrier-protein] ligase n=1 Tax=Methylocystis sp. JAN1 TaxID=3397211 RepID=UPI003FA1E4FF
METATKSKRVADGNILDRLFRPMGVEGVYARTREYEEVADVLQQLISRHRPDDAEVFRFPPVMSLRQLETQGYLNSFPQLLGCVCALHGTETDVSAAVDRARRGADWTSETTSADLVLSPAACYPIYPIAAEKGPVPARGLTFDVAADCFRHEPSKDLDRLQSFRMREYVRIGAPAQIATFREQWMQRAQSIAEALQLPYRFDRASDPFFGRVGQLMAANQIEQALKFELLIPVRAEGGPTACMSFNYHRDHFGKTWGLTDESGETAHSGCVAFGIDRLALALFATHGLIVGAWPRAVLQVLRLD